jgi:hypothetical protein
MEQLRWVCDLSKYLAMLKKKKILVTDDRDKIAKEDTGDNLEAKKKRPDWLKWFLNLIDTIVTVFS